MGGSVSPGVSISRIPSGTQHGKAKEFLEIRVQGTEFWRRMNLGIAVNPAKVPRGGPGPSLSVLDPGCMDAESPGLACAQTLRQPTSRHLDPLVFR